MEKILENFEGAIKEGVVAARKRCFDNGGQAFPSGSKLTTNPDGTFEMGPMFDGMSLRDWFAGMAMQGLLHSGWDTNSLSAPKMAYRIADAMIAEKKREE